MYSPVQYKGHLYLLTSSAMSWTQAEAQAKALNGHLVTINDADENDWLKETFSDYYDYAWIGYSDAAREGVWKWVDGSSSAYTRWSSGEPNNLGNEDYAHLYTDGTWNDLANLTGWQVSGIIEISNPHMIAGDSRDNKLSGTPNADQIYGYAGNDVLDGASGNDVMIGGGGDDTYLVRDAGDVVMEDEAYLGGVDQVNSYLANYSLGVNVENGRIMSTSRADLTGNAFSNVLYVGLGDNVVDGGLGDDTVSYALGSIAGRGVTVNLGLSAAQKTGGSGSDTLLNIENLSGSNYADNLTGNAGANSIFGDGGNDSIDGGAGDDTAIFPGNSSGYRVDYVRGGVTVTDIDNSNGNLGKDTLSRIEALQFSDKTISVSQMLDVAQIFDAHGGKSVGMVGTLANFSKAAYSLGAWEKENDNARINDEADSGGAVGSGRHADDVKGELFATEWMPLTLAVDLPGISHLTEMVSSVSIDVATFWNSVPPRPQPPDGYVPGTIVNSGVGDAVYAEIVNKYEDGLYTCGGSAALVARCGNSLVLSFRGTNDNRDSTADSGKVNDADLTDTYDNVYRPDVGEWHAMANHYQNFAPLLNALKSYLTAHSEIATVYVTGHSLGGAMALKYMEDHKNSAQGPTYEAVTFAAPAYDAFADHDSRITNIEIQDDPVPKLYELFNPQGDILYFIGDGTLTEDVNNHSMEYYRDVAWDVDDETWAMLLASKGETEILLSGQRSVSNRIEDFVVSTRDDTLSTVVSEPAMNNWHVDRDIDVIYGGGGNDTLRGDSSAEQLLGGAGDDILDGGAGGDTMVGGAGSDVYFVDDLKDVVTESNATSSIGGIDTVCSSLRNYTLGGNVEKGRILAAGSANLTGNTIDNLLYAGDGNNVLDGKEGIDTVSYLFSTGGVKVNLSLSRATGASSFDTLLGIENITGSDFDDTLTGSNAANTIKGGGGDDVLNGGAGNDILDGGEGHDVYRFDSVLGSTNVDRIDHYIVLDDGIELENAIFRKLAVTGTLKSEFFVANTRGDAVDANDYIIYETDTGKLLYDADGSGAGAAVLIAVIGAGLDMTNTEFVVT